jgi:enterochelin esterase-like enzyme
VPLAPARPSLAGRPSSSFPRGFLAAASAISRFGKYPAGKVQDVNYQSPVTNSTRKMVVYTPSGYDPNKKYPVLYGVHGIGAWPSTIFDDWCCGGAFVSDNLLGEKKIEPLIMVAMDNDNVDSHRELFEAIMPYVESHYPVIADADHRAIYGYSLGGGVTFAEGLGHLDTFHHICPTSAANFNHPSDAAMFPNGGAEAKENVKTLFISCGDADWDGFYPPNLATHSRCGSGGAAVPSVSDAGSARSAWSAARTRTWGATLQNAASIGQPSPLRRWISVKDPSTRGTQVDTAIQCAAFERRDPRITSYTPDPKSNR